jgi:predicted nucleotidyltransferase component of viral defense system
MAQDVIVMEVYDNFPETVLHGGTAIWRCYKGNRFSEDVNLYIPPAARSKLEDLVSALGARGLRTRKFKVNRSTAFGKFAFSDVLVGLEGSFRAARNHVVKPFEMLDGGFMLVNTLPPEELVVEKASAYKGRRKVRDLYDIFFLIHLAPRSGKVIDALGDLIENFQRPVDERVLKTVIISGSVPSVQDMLEAIEAWAR